MKREIVTTITKSGQVTLPAEVRRLLGLKLKDKVAFAIDGHEVRLLPARSVMAELAGSVKTPPHISDVDTAIREAKEEMIARAVEEYSAQ